MNVELEHNPLVLLLTEEVFCLRGVTLHLLLNGRSDGRNKVERVEVEVVTQDLGKLLRCQQVLILVPEESVTQFLA